MDPVLLAQTATLNTQGLVTWVVQNILPLIFCIVGVIIMASAKKGRYSESMSTVGILLIGACVIAGGIFFYAFAESIVGITFGGGGTAPATGPQP